MPDRNPPSAFLSLIRFEDSQSTVSEITRIDDSNPRAGGEFYLFPRHNTGLNLEEEGKRVHPWCKFFCVNLDGVREANGYILFRNGFRGGTRCEKWISRRRIYGIGGWDTRGFGD